MTATSNDPSTELVEIRCARPFQAGTVRCTRRRGELTVSIVAKLTYQLRQGACVVVDDGDPIRTEEEHWEGDPKKSLRYAADLVPGKGAPEVLVVGHARASTKNPARSLIVRVVVGSVDKCIEAFSPRRFSRDGQYEELYTLAEIPLLYEYAAGGPDTDNPVGIDPTHPDPSGHIALPALTPPAFPVSRGGLIPVVGLGPIAASWPQRARRLRPEDARWIENMLATPMPANFDERYFNAAPIDQHLDQPIRPDERIILEGLDSATPRLVTNLPGIEPRIVSEVGAVSGPKLLADTLVIDTDRNVLTLTFRGRLDLPLGSGRLRFAIVPVRAGEELSDEEIDAARRMIAEPKQAKATAEPTLMIQLSDEAQAALGTTNMGFDPNDLKHSALPFASSTEPRTRQQEGRPSGDGALPFRSKRVMAESTQPIPVHLVPSSAPKPPPPAPPPPSSPGAAPPAPAPIQIPAPVQVPAIQVPAPVQVPAPMHVPAPVAPPPLAPASVALPTSSTSPSPASGMMRGPLGGIGSAPSALSGLGSQLGPAATGGSSGKPSYLMNEVAAAPPPPAVVLSPSTPTVSAEELPSAKAASDKAVDAEPKRLKKNDKKEESSPLRRRALVDLLGFDPALPPRLRRAKVHGDLLVTASKVRGFRRLDEGNAEKEDKGPLDVLRVLSLGEPVEPSALRAVVDAALDDVQDLDIPVLLVSGELRPTFDEIETLRLTASVAQAFAGGEKRVLSAVAVINEAIGASAPPTGKAAAGLLVQLDQATASLNLPPRYIQETVERALLEQRKYRRKTLFGQPRLRADLSVGGVSSFPIYLMEEVAAKLPLLPSFQVVALVEVRPREDISESQSEALLGLALGRVVRNAR